MRSVVITRLKGGIGNQLFCYAAARRLSLNNDAELAIDDVTGFSRDKSYYRQYMLDQFQIPARKASPFERMEPFERYRRGIAKLRARMSPYGRRNYIEQHGCDFDRRLLDLKFSGTIYLDGYWQSEAYFKDVEGYIRKDLEIKPPTDDMNRHMASEIRSGQSVAIHVRWFYPPGDARSMNVAHDYYLRAISLIEHRINKPKYFLFSDNPEAAMSMLSMTSARATVISHNQGDMNAFKDLWLMTLCHHFIIANSTFSWWGAWLGGRKDKIIVAPVMKNQGVSSWGFKGLIPDVWIKL